MGEQPKAREARLRPEFALAYPGLEQRLLGVRAREDKAGTLMPNETNVQAPTAAIRKAWAARAGDWARRHNAKGTNPQPLPSMPWDFRRLAVDLAAEGVLVASALTDDELLACEVDQESRETPLDRAEVAAVVRERLERFARGEPRAAGAK